MAEKDQPKPANSQTLDLSTGRPGRKKKSMKGVAPVVQQTINLSTPKPEIADVENPPEPKRAPTPRNRNEKKENPKRRVTGNSLADLLDAETLAKLRRDS